MHANADNKNHHVRIQPHRQSPVHCTQERGKEKQDKRITLLFMPHRQSPWPLVMTLALTCATSRAPSTTASTAVSTSARTPHVTCAHVQLYTHYVWYEHHRHAHLTDTLADASPAQVANNRGTHYVLVQRVCLTL